MTKKRPVPSARKKMAAKQRGPAAKDELLLLVEYISIIFTVSGAA